MNRGIREGGEERGEEEGEEEGRGGDYYNFWMVYQKCVKSAETNLNFVQF